MRKLILGFASLALLLTTACSTTGHFRLPQGTTLKVTDRTVAPDAEGKWTTSPFFWSEAGGIPYQLMNESGHVVRSGTLKSQFRVASIFWPPLAIIYWPMGFKKGEFDLTRPGDGYMVRDNMTSNATVSVPESVEAAEPAPAPAAIPKKKKRK